MTRKKLQYMEGDWFAIPLRNGGYALGLIARMDGKGEVLGYFFGPRHQDLPLEQETKNLSPSSAILIRRIGDLGLLRGEWPIVAHSPHWRREEWPQPAFGRIAMDESWASQVEYSEDDLSQVIREVPVSLAEARNLPEDGLSGYGAAEIRLTKLLSS
jgi:hypothetical protein